MWNFHQLNSNLEKKAEKDPDPKFDILPRVMTLKTAKYRRIFKQPKSIDYQAIMMADPSKNNKRFINTCKNANKKAFGGGFQLKNQPENIQYLFRI